MRDARSNRTCTIICRLTPDEYKQLEKKFKASTCRKLSEFVRKRLFDRPYVTTYRNASLDDFMSEMMKLRAELNALGNNFNQAVKKLHTLNQIPEFKHWLITHEQDKQKLFSKMNVIKDSINKIADKWLL